MPTLRKKFVLRSSRGRTFTVKSRPPWRTTPPAISRAPASAISHCGTISQKRPPASCTNSRLSACPRYRVPNHHNTEEISNSRYPETNMKDTKTDESTLFDRSQNESSQSESDGALGLGPRTLQIKRLVVRTSIRASGGVVQPEYNSTGI